MSAIAVHMLQIGLSDVECWQKQHTPPLNGEDEEKNCLISIDEIFPSGPEALAFNRKKERE